MSTLSHLRLFFPLQACFIGDSVDDVGSHSSGVILNMTGTLQYHLTHIYTINTTVILKFQYWMSWILLMIMLDGWIACFTYMSPTVDSCSMFGFGVSHGFHKLLHIFLNYINCRVWFTLNMHSLYQGFSNLVFMSYYCLFASKYTCWAQ